MLKPQVVAMCLCERCGHRNRDVTSALSGSALPMSMTAPKEPVTNPTVSLGPTRRSASSMPEILQTNQLKQSRNHIGAAMFPPGTTRSRRRALPSASEALAAQKAYIDRTLTSSLVRALNTPSANRHGHWPGRARQNQGQGQNQRWYITTPMTGEGAGTTTRMTRRKQ